MTIEIADIHNLLRKRQALLVHFSGAPRGSGVARTDNEFPSDLLNVASGHAMGGISCSTVTPNDNFYGLDRNATGCIGVIVDLTSLDSLVAADVRDTGSIEVNGIREVNKQILSVEHLERSIDCRGPHYNEWVVRNYRVLGILAVPPFEVEKRFFPPRGMSESDLFYEGEPVPGTGHTTIANVLSIFADLPVYTLRDGTIVCCRSERVVTFDVVYRIAPSGTYP